MLASTTRGVVSDAIHELRTSAHAFYEDDHHDQIAPANIVNQKPVAGPNRRARIIEAAAHCFDLYSIQRTTIDDIVKASGFSRPTIYREFSNKDEIAQCVAVNASQEITLAVQEAIADIDNSRDRIITAILASIEFRTTNRRAHDGLSGDFRLVILRSASPEVVEAVTGRWMPILTAAVADGTLRQDLDLNEAVNWLTDLTSLLAARYLAHEETPDDTRRKVERYVLDGLCARS